MESFSIFQLSADPLGSASVTADAEFVVEIIDNDGTLSDPDGDGSQQFETAGLPGAINSANTQVFELYTGMVGGQPVEFILIRFTAPPLMVLTEGTLVAGETITNVAVQNFNAPPIDFEDIPTFVCFCADTFVETSKGLRRIGELEVGDCVAVQSGGHRPIRWIASREISRRDLHRRPSLRPVRICQGSLGYGLPTADLILSRQHRVLVSSKIVERVIGHPAALISANKLTTLPGVYVDQKIDAITYVHLMLDEHEILTTAGVAAESLYLGPNARASLTPEALAEIKLLFPELYGLDGSPSTRHQIPCGRQQKAIVRRHLKNGRPLCPILPTASVWHQTTSGRCAATASRTREVSGAQALTSAVSGH